MNSFGPNTKGIISWRHVCRYKLHNVDANDVCPTCIVLGLGIGGREDWYLRRNLRRKSG